MAALTQEYMPGVVCPGCGVLVKPILHGSVGARGWAEGFVHTAALVRCPDDACRERFLIYVHYFLHAPGHPDRETMTVEGVWPPPSRKAPEGVLKEIAPDYVEAHRCLVIGAHVAAALMVRRVVESACNERGATERDLVDKIKQLGKANKIHPIHVETATAARLLGKDAAHLLRDITKGEVEALFDLLDHFLQDLYTTPLTQSKIQHARQVKKA